MERRQKILDSALNYGIIKELWLQDDCRITIAGIFQGEDAYN
jgi:hypothetical protein